MHIGSSSSSSLSCDRSIASSKLSSPKCAILSFLLQLPVSSCFLQVIQQLLTSPSSPSCPYNLTYRISVGKLEGRRPLGRPRRMPTELLDFFFLPSSGVLGSRNATFRKLDLFPSSGERGRRHLLSWAPIIGPVIEISSF
jgi:hypothetical protein